MRFLPEGVEFEKPEICILVDVAAVLRTFCPNETVVAAMYFAALAGTIPGLEETYEGGFGLLKCNEQLELVSSVVRGKLCWTPVSLMTMAACDKAIGTSKTEEFARLWQELVETAHLSLKNFSKNPTSKQYLDKVLDGYRPMFEPYLPSLTPMDIASACEVDVLTVPLEKALESFNAMCEKVNALSRKVVTRVTENSYANRAVGEREIKALVAIAEKRGEAATLLAARYKSEAPNVDCTFLQEYEGLTTQLVKNWNAIYAGVGHQSEESPKTDPPRVAGGQGLAAVAGMSVLKAQLQEEVVDVFRDPERFKKYGILIPNGILFFGPPGCGKTYIARQLASELGYSFFEIVPSDIGSSYVHGTALKIRETFDEAAKKAPSILFIDEFEALVPSRDSVGSGHQYKSEEVNEFLTQMGGCADRRVLLIAATNQPWEIDSAVQRAGRLDKKIYVAPPDLTARGEILAHHLNGRYTSPELNTEAMASQLSGYSSSDLKLLVDEAAKLAFKADEPISEKHVVAAKSIVPLSISSEEEAKYQQFAARGSSASLRATAKLGFHN
jgi:hypothetical protein